MPWWFYGGVHIHCPVEISYVSSRICNSARKVRLMKTFRSLVIHSQFLPQFLICSKHNRQIKHWYVSLRRHLRGPILSAQFSTHSPAPLSKIVLSHWLIFRGDYPFETFVYIPMLKLSGVKTLKIQSVVEMRCCENRPASEQFTSLENCICPGHTHLRARCTLLASFFFATYCIQKLIYSFFANTKTIEDLT